MEVRSTVPVTVTASEERMPFKPFIESIGHETLSQGGNESADELNNTELDAPILPEHVRSYNNYTDADLALEREEHDILGHGNVVNVWNRVQAFESERYATMYKDSFVLFTYSTV